MLSAQSISMAELLDARLSLAVPIAGRAEVNADDAVVARLEDAIEAATGHQPGTDPFNCAPASTPRRSSTSTAIVRAVRRRQRAAAERATAVHIEYLMEVLETGETPRDG